MLRFLDELLDTFIKLPLLILLIVQVIYGLCITAALAAVILVVALAAKDRQVEMGLWLKRKAKIALGAEK